MKNIIDGIFMLEKPAQYIVFAIVAFALLAIIIKIVKFIRKFSKILSNKKYRKNPDSSVLTQMQQSAINIGAINSEQTMYYADSLKTGDSKSAIASNLAQYYEISPDLTPAKEVLHWLCEEGHKIYFDAMKDDFAHSEHKEWIKKAEVLFAEDQEKLGKCIDFMNNLEASIPTLIAKGYINNRLDLEKISIAAWDMGRLVNITRCCLDCGYITKDEAWGFINTAYDESKKTYKDWKEFASGYIIGRAMWAGDNMMLNGIMGIASDLLNDADSPWIKSPLK